MLPSEQRHRKTQNLIKQSNRFPMNLSSTRRKSTNYRPSSQLSMNWNSAENLQTMSKVWLSSLIKTKNSTED